MRGPKQIGGILLHPVAELMGALNGFANVGRAIAHKTVLSLWRAQMPLCFDTLTQAFGNTSYTNEMPLPCRLGLGERTSR